MFSFRSGAGAAGVEVKKDFLLILKQRREHTEVEGRGRKERSEISENISLETGENAEKEQSR